MVDAAALDQGRNPHCSPSRRGPHCSAPLCLAELAQRRGRSELVVSLALIFADIAVGATYVTTKFAELAVHSIQLQEQARRDVEDAIVKKYGSTENFKAWLKKSWPAR